MSTPETTRRTAERPQFQRHCPGCFQFKGGVAVCPHCGYDEGAPRSAIFLPHGITLGGQYRVGRVLGRPGGFGITYLGWDINLQQRVAIKEYLPREIATRSPNSLDVSVHTAEDKRGFEFGKEQFLREARIVAKLDHPNIVRVRNFFNANGTAYLVMDYYEGMSLGDYLSSVRARLEPELAVPLVKPILDGLQYVHERGLVHRDLKPHNIYLAAVGRPIVLDFGAARQAAGDRVQSMSVVLTEGYAPLEQYQRRAVQGPWTDVYGVAATLYRVIVGQAPPIALDRIGRDPLEESNWAGVSPELVEAFKRALAVRPNDRYQTAQEFRQALDYVYPDTITEVPVATERKPLFPELPHTQDFVVTMVPLQPPSSYERAPAPEIAPRISPEITAGVQSLVERGRLAESMGETIVPQRPLPRIVPIEPSSANLQTEPAPAIRRVSPIVALKLAPADADADAPITQPMAPVVRAAPPLANAAPLPASPPPIPPPEASARPSPAPTPQAAAPAASPTPAAPPPEPTAAAQPAAVSAPAARAEVDRRTYVPPPRPKSPSRWSPQFIVGTALVLLTGIGLGYVLMNPPKAAEASNPSAVPAITATTSTARNQSSVSEIEDDIAPPPASQPAEKPTEPPSRLPEFIATPAGSVRLAEPASAEGPAGSLQVAVPALAVSVSEVTVGDFSEFVRLARYENPLWQNYPCQSAGGRLPEWNRPGYSQSDDYPVVCVSWADALAYAQWLTDVTGKRHRLPTEAEWEYFAKAGSGTRYWWGDEAERQMASCQGCPPKVPVQPSAVGSFPANRFGLHEIAGNVREWTCSAYAPYNEGAAQSCTSAGKRIALRGGSWQQPLASLGSQQRDSADANHRDVWTGFRLLRED